MKIMNKRMVAAAMLAAAFFGSIAFFLLFENYEYYDYQRAFFSNNPVRVSAGLYGDFSKENPSVRSAPYELGFILETEGNAASASIALSDVALYEKKSGNRINLPAARVTEIEGETGSYVHYAYENLDIPYEDYEVCGIVRTHDGKPQQIKFRLDIVRKYGSEWRIPLIDIIMSV